jgi:LPXTG-site transpeptidase (sortase) family protein
MVASRFVNSLVILFGAYLILLGLVHLVPMALEDTGSAGFSESTWSPIPLTGEQSLAPIVPLAPLENPTPAEAAGAPIPASNPNTFTPDRIVIPQIGLDAPVVPAVPDVVHLEGQDFRIWDVPAGFQAGWHSDSARLGEPGNMVLNGHHNVHGQVFARLVDLEIGAEVLVGGEGNAVRYRVTNRLLLPEKDQPLEMRLSNAHWMLPSQENRLTLITCWPYETNTHRLIVIAEPAP